MNQENTLNEIHIFDFDGTLFNSPLNTPENRFNYEQETGIPWLVDKQKSAEILEKQKITVNPRSGWWGRPETLEPPLVPCPAPIDLFNLNVVDQYHKSKQNPSALTIIMTGRHKGLSKQVKRICCDGKLFDEDEDVLIFFLGDDGPDPQDQKPHETLPWKIWIVNQFIRKNPSIKKAVFWEDREEHIPHFLNLENLEEVIVHQVLS